MITILARNLVPARVLFQIVPMNTRGPATFSGKQQVVGTDAGFWKATLSDFIVRKPEQILEWRGMVAELEGGLNDLIVGPFDCRQAPVIPGVPPIVLTTHSDGTPFSDGTRYSQSSIVVVADQSLSLRQTTMRVGITAAGDLRKGMYFSVLDERYLPRLHIITSVPEISGAKASFSFRPPLRAAVSAGARIEFSDPKATMTLANDDAGGLDINLRRFASPSLELVESWNGL